MLLLYKSQNAAAAGAIAALVFNEGQPGRTDANSGTCNPIVCSIPTLTTSFAVGDFLAQLLDGGPVTVRIAVTAEDLAISAVPEPGTLSIFNFMAAALSLMRRRWSAVTPHERVWVMFTQSTPTPRRHSALQRRQAARGEGLDGPHGSPESDLDLDEHSALAQRSA